jgi:hypothetical protein
MPIKQEIFDSENKCYDIDSILQYIDFLNLLYTKY